MLNVLLYNELEEQFRIRLIMYYLKYSNLLEIFSKLSTNIILSHKF